jgi:hypothetical protein
VYCLSVRNQSDVKTSFLHSHGPSASYIHPAMSHILRLPQSAILAKVSSNTATGHTYTLISAETKLKTENGIRTVVLSSLVHLSLNNLLLQLVFNIHKNHLHQNSNPGHFFRLVAFVPKIFSLKQKISVISIFCYHLFPRYRKHLHWDSNPGQFFGL